MEPQQANHSPGHEANGNHEDTKVAKTAMGDFAHSSSGNGIAGPGGP